MPDAARHMTPLAAMLATYAVLKAAMIASVIYAFYNVIGADPFIFPDFIRYVKCTPSTPNVLFAYSLCAMGIDDIGNAGAFWSAGLANTVRDVIYIAITFRVLGKRAAWMLSLLIALHPFLALYHLRYVSSIGASLAVLLLFAMEVRDGRAAAGRMRTLFIIGSSAILVAYRYTNALLLGVYLLVRNRRNPPVLIAVVVMGVFFFTNSREYVIHFITVSNGIDNHLSFDSVVTDAVYTGLPVVDPVIGLLFYLVSHLVFLTGFRESAFITFPEYFLPLDTRAIVELTVYLSMSAFHITGLALFFRAFRHYRDMCLTFMTTLFFTILFIVHLRYFIGFIPLVLIGYASLSAPSHRAA